MSSSLAVPCNPWLHRFACFTALSTLVLIVIGGLVTSHGAGMAVPDWPNSYGYNMFLFPVSKWVGGILYEHSHRLVATFVGLLTVMLTRWLGGAPSRLPLMIIGVLEIALGEGVLRFAPEWSSAGHFLAGIGGVVLIAGIVWVRKPGLADTGRKRIFGYAPAARPLPLLGWIAFVAVQIQGMLGGLRVVLFKDEIGVFHATLAQLFFVLLCAITLLTSRTWNEDLVQLRGLISKGFPRLVVITSVLILGQLVIGATMRHQHAGLAVPDFPLAYGKLWPATDPNSVEFYNAHRMEIESYKPITAFQIQLQMAHRLLALAIFGCIVVAVRGAWQCKGAEARTIRQICLFWLALVVMQAGLGAATIWSQKAADVATAHVLVGALLLATGAILSIVTVRSHLLAASLQPVFGRSGHDSIPTGLAPSSAK